MDSAHRSHEGRARVRDAGQRRTASSNAKSLAAATADADGNLVQHQRQDSAARSIHHRRSRTARRDLMERQPGAAAHDGTIAIGIRSRAVRAAARRADGRQRRSAPAARHRRALSSTAVSAARCTSRTTLESLRGRSPRRRRIAIESARLYAEAAEKGRIERELRVAADIQRALLADPAYEGRFCDLVAMQHSLPHRRRRLLRLSRARRWRLRLRPRRRRGQGRAGRPAGRGRADELCRAGTGRRRPGRDDGENQRRAAAARGRCPVRDDVLRRARSGRSTCTTRTPGRSRRSWCADRRGVAARGRWSGHRAAERRRLRVGDDDAASRATSSWSAATVSPRRAVSSGEEFGRDRAIEALRPCHGQKPDVVMDALMAVDAGIRRRRASGRRHHRRSSFAIWDRPRRSA